MALLTNRLSRCIKTRTGFNPIEIRPTLYLFSINFFHRPAGRPDKKIIGAEYVNMVRKYGTRRLHLWFDESGNLVKVYTLTKLVHIYKEN